MRHTVIWRWRWLGFSLVLTPFFARFQRSFWSSRWPTVVGHRGLPCQFVRAVVLTLTWLASLTCVQDNNNNHNNNKCKSNICKRSSTNNQQPTTNNNTTIGAHVFSELFSRTQLQLSNLQQQQNCQTKERIFWDSRVSSFLLLALRGHEVHSISWRCRVSQFVWDFADISQ